MNSNDVEVEVGRLRPLEIALKYGFFAAIADIAAGKMTTAEVVGILDEVKLTVQGVFDYPEEFECE